MTGCRVGVCVMTASWLGWNWGSKAVVNCVKLAYLLVSAVRFGGSGFVAFTRRGGAE